MKTMDLNFSQKCSLHYHVDSNVGFLNLTIYIVGISHVSLIVCLSLCMFPSISEENLINLIKRYK